MEHTFLNMISYLYKMSTVRWRMLFLLDSKMTASLYFTASFMVGRASRGLRPGDEGGRQGTGLGKVSARWRGVGWVLCLWKPWVGTLDGTVSQSGGVPPVPWTLVWLLDLESWLPCHGAAGAQQHLRQQVLLASWLGVWSWADRQNYLRTRKKVWPVRSGVGCDGLAKKWDKASKGEDCCQGGRRPQPPVPREDAGCGAGTRPPAWPLWGGLQQQPSEQRLSRTKASKLFLGQNETWKECWSFNISKYRKTTITNKTSL